MEADGAPSTPLPLSVLRFTGIQSYSYTDQRKVEADVEVIIIQRNNKYVAISESGPYIKHVFICFQGVDGKTGATGTSGPRGDKVKATNCDLFRRYDFATSKELSFVQNFSFCIFLR